MTIITLRQLYDILLAEIGPQNWPAQSKAEIIVGAVLVQNTAWRNVEYSIDNLREATDFQPEALAQIDEQTLQALIRPSGFYKNKSRAILEIFHWLSTHDNNYQSIQQKYAGDLRKELFTLRGVGEETADVLLLYIFDQAVFVADTYARRIFSQMSLQDTNFQTYRQLKQAVEPLAGFSLEEAQIFHGLIDEFGKLHSRDIAPTVLDEYRLDI